MTPLNRPLRERYLKLRTHELKRKDFLRATLWTCLCGCAFGLISGVLGVLAFVHVPSLLVDWAVIMINEAFFGAYIGAIFGGMLGAGIGGHAPLERHKQPRTTVEGVCYFWNYDEMRRGLIKGLVVAVILGLVIGASFSFLPEAIRQFLGGMIWGAMFLGIIGAFFGWLFPSRLVRVSPEDQPISAVIGTANCGIGLGGLFCGFGRVILWRFGWVEQIIGADAGQEKTQTAVLGIVMLASALSGGICFWLRRQRTDVYKKFWSWIRRGRYGVIPTVLFGSVGGVLVGMCTFADLNFVLIPLTYGAWGALGGAFVAFEDRYQHFDYGPFPIHVYFLSNRYAMITYWDECREQ